jgi:hypothetical protein
LRSIGGFLSDSQQRTEDRGAIFGKRHTGVLEEEPSSKATLGCAHESMYAGEFGAAVF